MWGGRRGGVVLPCAVAKRSDTQLFTRVRIIYLLYDGIGLIMGSAASKFHLKKVSVCPEFLSIFFSLVLYMSPQFQTKKVSFYGLF